MKLTVGEKVYYPGRGPCLVGAIVQKVVCGMSASFYQLTLLDGSGAELFVPIGNFGDLHVRSLLTPFRNPQIAAPAEAWRGTTERSSNNQKLAPT